MEKTFRALLRPLKFNFKSELFASTFAYGSTAVIRLGSSLILTRLLTPAAYGIFAILLSIVFMLELLSDVGSHGLLVRHPRGDDVRFIHTIWTIRLIRSLLNFGILLTAAPLLASLYRTPELTPAFRLLSFTFLLSGVQTMSFTLAERHRKARLFNYTELSSNAVMTISVIGLAFVLRNEYALIYGALLQRAFVTLSSYFFYRNIGVGIAFDREAIVEQFRFSRVVTPSSILTVILTQYDRLIFLRLFSAATLGVYSIAGNMLAPIKSIIVNNARRILYARCSEYFRMNRLTAVDRYYAENNKLLFMGILPPAVVSGFSQSIVSVLYDPRYTFAGYVLMVLGLGTIVSAFFNASERILVASGLTHAVLVGNAVRVLTLVPASLLGYYLYGLQGFLWFNLAATLPPLAYVQHQQHKRGLLRLRSEFKLMGIALGVFLACLTVSHLLLAWIPAGWLHMKLKAL